MQCPPNRTFSFIQFAVLFVLGWSLATSASGFDVWFVDVDADPGGDGTTWGTAFDNLDDGLAAATTFQDQVWVAEGLYLPGSGGARGPVDPTVTFEIPGTVRVYGGFAGGEGSLDNADPEAHPTVLSGDLEGNDATDTDGVTLHWQDIVGTNAHHVVTFAGSGRLEGFVITGGQADGSSKSDDDRGAAIRCESAAGEPTLRELTVLGNTASDEAIVDGCENSLILLTSFLSNHAGAGAVVSITPSTYAGCLFEGNEGGTSGGGVLFVDEQELSLDSSIFRGNVSPVGGIVQTAVGADLSVSQVLFVGNQGEVAAIDVQGFGSNRVENSTFLGNVGSATGGTLRVGSGASLTLVNSILWNNEGGPIPSERGTVIGLPVVAEGSLTAIANIVQLGSSDETTFPPGLGNLDVDPEFVFAPEGVSLPRTDFDAHLREGSPAIDSGSSLFYSGISVDLDGNTREQGSEIDMGVYEGGVPGADVEVTKTDGRTEAVPGQDQLIYEIVVSFTGPTPADIGLTDAFPPALECSWVAESTGDAVGLEPSGDGDIDQLFSLIPDEVATLTATCDVDPGASGAVANTATVLLLSEDLYDEDAANDSATDLTELTPEADLSISKDDGVVEVEPGQQVTYVLEVANAGPSHAPASMVTDTFPPELENCTTACLTADVGCPENPIVGDVDVSLDLDVGVSAVLHATCDVITGDFVEVENTATVAPGAGIVDPNPADNSASDVDVDSQSVVFRDDFETGDLTEWSG